MDRRRKRELRDQNARAWAGESGVFAVGNSLDSSMKKNTAFIRRLRTSIGASGLSSILQEIKTLSLHKYLSEIISACYEGLTKLKLPVDIAAGVEVFSALHQRFGPHEFTCFVGWLIGRGMSTPDKAQLKSLPQDVRDKEEKERLARHKVLLRLSTELWLAGALRSLDDVKPPEDAAKTKDSGKPLQPSATKGAAAAKASDAVAEPFPLEALKELLAQDGHHLNLTMVAQFAKVFSWDLLGKADADSDHADDPPLADAAMQQRFKNIISRYFETAKLHLARDQSSLSNQNRRNAEAYVRSGEIFEDRQANFDKMVKSQEKFVSNLQTLADCLGAEMPELKEDEADSKANESNIGLVKTGEYLRGEGDSAGIWEDDDQRRFYENLIDLKDRVPTILLEDARRKKHDNDEQVGKRVDDASNKQAESKEAATTATTNGETAEVAGNDQSTSIANKTVGAQVDALLARLPHVTGKEGIDEIAVDFCFVNSKASRNRLLKAVQDVPRARSDLLPLYSRLVATLGKYMPDVTQGLVANLEDEFKSLQRRKQKDSLGGVRTSNIRYLAELTKFGVVPEHKIFHCFKVSLDDFSKMNIEIICNLLENCGRYLLRHPETAPRMRSFLETLLRKKSAQHLAQQEKMLIENAAYTVDPPERAAIQQKERTPLDLFLRKLVYMDLNKRNVERVIKQIRKLHWEEPEVVQTLHKIFVKPGRIKYSNIHFLAIILGSLNRYHQNFSVSVIDDLLESITLGLELNEFKYNQRRLAEARYLGELYVYRMIDSSIIFDTMYRILTYGHNGWPKPGQASPLDLPDDFFRVRLVCSLLETCGTYYDKGAARKKLDFFLTFFQYYIQTKEPTPMDVEFIIQDTFSLVRPQWKIAKTLDEAGATFADACRENYKRTGSERPVDIVDDEQEVIEGDEDGDHKGRRSSDAPDDSSSSDEAEQQDGDDDRLDSSDDESEDEDEEEHIVVTRPEEERDPEADADFDRELAAIMAESVTDSRKSDKKPMFDVALPMRRAQRDNTTGEDAPPAMPPFNPETVQFSLLSKRGNKPQTRSIDLPANSSFAVAHRSQLEAEKAEQQRIKALVLNYESTDTAANGQDGDPSHLLCEPPPLNVNPNHANRIGRRIKNRKPVSSAELPPEHGTDSRQGSIDRPISQPAVSGRQGDGGNRTGNRRNQGQARKLQLSDVDWYGREFPSASN